jgi:C1A family cysteine protease
MKRRYNWRPDKPDIRDHKYSLTRLAAPLPAIPAIVDLSSGFPPVFDQGDIGSCTGNGCAAAYDYLELLEQRQKLPVTAAHEEFQGAYDNASRLFIYYNERALEGTVSQDAGAEIRDGIKVLNQTGVCRESVWPYGDPNVFVKPSDAAYAEAALHKIVNYQRLESLDDVRHCIASGYPVVIGFSVYTQFESDEMAATGELQLPGPSDQLLGGHCVVISGYNDTASRVRCRNSWGTGWGIGGSGYFHMPYAYLTNPDLSSDWWMIKKT